jgi:hypothetical protein
VAGIGEGSVTGSSRKLLTRAREELRLDVFEHAISLHRDRSARGISSWKERDKLSSAFLLSNVGPRSGLSSPIFAEALATLLSLPSRVCKDRLGERVGASQVDRYGEKVILANLPGGHWTSRHNAMEQEIASLCAYAGLPAECEPFGLFGHLLPQQALHRLQQHQKKQVLRPDLRLEVPATKVRLSASGARPRRGPPAAGAARAAGAPRAAVPAAPPAPLPINFSGSYIAEIKVIGKGAKDYYKMGTRAQRAVDKRAKEVPGEYRDKAAEMDTALGVQGEGPCQRRLAELPLMALCWGAYGEGSPDVHTLISLIATCRVRHLALQGRTPGPHQMGLEVSTIRRRLSTAAVRAANTTLLARMGQVGEGSSLAGKRRAWQRMEERAMQLQQEGDWLVTTTGREVVQRGRFWGR